MKYFARQWSNALLTYDFWSKMDIFIRRKQDCSIPLRSYSLAKAYYGTDGLPYVRKLP